MYRGRGLGLSFFLASSSLSVMRCTTEVPGGTDLNPNCGRMVPDLLRHIRITDYTYRSVLGHRYSKVPLVLESTCVVLRLFMAILPSLGFIELTNAMYGTAY